MTRGIQRLGLALCLGSLATVAAAQPQPAPPPRELPPAELLVGRWRLIKFGEKPVPTTSRDILIFTTKGKFSSTLSHVSYPDETVTGSYRLVGRVIELSTEPPRPPMTDQLSLIEVTRTRLIVQHGQQVSFRRSEYVRDEGK
jgi:hypothetical protein